MKSSNKKLIEKDGELVLEISIEDKDSELFERLKRIVTTQKLPNNSGKRIK
jgi:hypothetical protein